MDRRGVQPTKHEVSEACVKWVDGELLHGRQLAVSERTTLGSQACATLRFAGLFVEFPAPHFLLDTASLDELSEAANCFLN